MPMRTASSVRSSCHSLGAGGRRSPGQTHLAHHFFFFQNLIMMGTDPGPGLPRCSPCEYLHRALLWEPGITQAWHLSPACLVTLDRSKPHCKKSCSLCMPRACVPGQPFPMADLGRGLWPPTQDSSPSQTAKPPFLGLWTHPD